MKKFWKALGLAAIAAAVPVRFQKDEETGRKTYQSLLISVDVDTDEEGKTADIGINLGDGLIPNAISGLVGKKRETVHFADDDPEAAVVPDVIDFTQAAKAQEEDNSGQEPDTSARHSEPAPVEEATEEDFDPEL